MHWYIKYLPALWGGSLSVVFFVQTSRFFVHTSFRVTGVLLVDLDSFCSDVSVRSAQFRRGNFCSDVGMHVYNSISPKLPPV